MHVIGITGCIGSGKSFVSNILSRMINAYVINADQFAKTLLDVNDLAEIFPDCLSSNGVDTKKIAEKVFKNRTDLDKLESYIFPKFRKEIVKEIARIRMTKKYNYLILEAPTLFESKSENICDFIITVTAPRKICISRALARNHFTEDQVRFILKRQTSNAYKLAKSDYSLVSDFGESFVVRKLNKIIGDINARCKNMS